MERDFILLTDRHGHAFRDEMLHQLKEGWVPTHVGMLTVPNQGQTQTLGWAVMERDTSKPSIEQMAEDRVARALADQVQGAGLTVVDLGDPPADTVYFDTGRVEPEADLVEMFGGKRPVPEHEINEAEPVGRYGEPEACGKHPCGDCECQSAE